MSSTSPLSPKHCAKRQPPEPEGSMSMMGSCCLCDGRSSQRVDPRLTPLLLSAAFVVPLFGHTTSNPTCTAPPSKQCPSHPSPEDSERASGATFPSHSASALARATRSGAFSHPFFFFSRSLGTRYGYHLKEGRTTRMRMITQAHSL